MSKKQIKFYISGTPRYQNYGSWLINRLDFQRVNTITEADILLLAGGEDIDPSIYGEKPLEGTCFNVDRDIMEISDAAYAVENKMPILGICRGAQLLCALAGGALVQDMQHWGSHSIIAQHPNQKTVSVVQVNSLHHQLQYPYCIHENEYELLAYARNVSTFFQNHINTVVDVKTIKQRGEPEIVYYKKLKGLGIQFHPEMMDISSAAVETCVEYVNHYLIPNITICETHAERI